MSDWPKNEDGVVFFRTRQVAEAAAAKCNAAKLEPGVKWSVLEKDGKFYVVAFIGRDLSTASRMPGAATARRSRRLWPANGRPSP